MCPVERFRSTAKYGFRWRLDYSSITNLSGFSFWFLLMVLLSVAGCDNLFTKPPPEGDDFETPFGGLSFDLIPGLEAGAGIFLFYQPKSGFQSYIIEASDGKRIVNRTLLSQDILSGNHTPWPYTLVGITAAGQTSRMLAAIEAQRYANIYEEIQNAK